MKRELWFVFLMFFVISFVGAGCEDLIDCENRDNLIDSDLVSSISDSPISEFDCYDFELNENWAKSDEGLDWLAENNLDIIDSDGDGDVSGEEKESYLGRFNEADFIFNPVLPRTENPCGKVQDCFCVIEGENCVSVRGTFETGEDCGVYGFSLEDFGVCVISDKQIVDECSAEGGEYKISWVAKWFVNEGNYFSGSSSGENEEMGCYSGDKDLPCPEKSFIPFFTWVNFFVAGGMVLIVYLFLQKKSL